LDLATLRDQVRELLSETVGNLPDPTLNVLIERATQRIEVDYADDRGAKPRQMLGQLTGTVTSDGLALPSDFQRARTVRIGSRNMRYTALENMPAETAQVDADVTGAYYKRIDKLVNDADTNWLLDIGARVYVYATAIEYTFWNKDSMQDRESYRSEYRDAAGTLARANSPRPAGGFGRSSGHIGGYYSINGDYMVFGGSSG
jgi:hypothetical protein